MTKQDIIRKLTSRKFWVAVVAFITPLLLAFGLDEFSVSPSAVLRSRKVIAQWSGEEAEKLKDRVMNCGTVEEVMACLTE